MTEQEKRKGGGGKLLRTETVTVRFDPKLRYLAELASRKQRRTLSSFIEWAIEDTLTRLTIKEWGNGQTSFAEEAENLWDVDDADRFARLALRYPELLTHEEQVRWKLVRECGYLWRGNYQGPENVWAWSVKEEYLRLDKLKENWDAFCKVANGDAPASSLPTWQRTGPPPPTLSKAKPSSGFDDMDDDIPF